MKTLKLLILALLLGIVHPHTGLAQEREKDPNSEKTGKQQIPAAKDDKTLAWPCFGYQSQEDVRGVNQACEEAFNQLVDEIDARFHTPAAMKTGQTDISRASLIQPTEPAKVL